MNNSNFLYLKNFISCLSLAALTLPASVHAQDSDNTRLRSEELYSCSMRLARSSDSRSSEVAIIDHELNLAYADEYTRDEGMQKIFYFAGAGSNRAAFREAKAGLDEYQLDNLGSKVAGQAVLGRLLRSEDPDRPILEVTFYRKKKKEKGLLDRGGLQHPELSHWQLVPSFTVNSESQENPDGGVYIFVDDSSLLNKRANTMPPSTVRRFVGNNTYQYLEFICNRK